MEYAAIISAVVGVLSSLFGAGKDGEAQALREKIAQQFGPDILPHLDKAVAEQLGSTAFEGVREDPSLRAAQLRALGQLEDVYANEGMTSADTAALNRAQDVAAGQAGSQYASLSQSLAARGMSPGGGLGVALASQVGQDATNSSARLAGDAQIAARQRALQALESGANLAGNVRSADYRLSSDKARAQDSINAFNTSARERANYFNLDAPQRNFDNIMAQRTAQANAANGVAAGYERGAQNIRSDGAAWGNSILTLGNYDTEKKKGGG